MLAHDLLVHLLHAHLLRQVGLHGVVADGMFDLVHADHHGALTRKPFRDRLADQAGRAVDDADLAGKSLDQLDLLDRESAGARVGSVARAEYRPLLA